MPRNHRPCAICDAPGCGTFFSVYSCRPCASFFRRSVRDRREYFCRQNGNCQIDKDGMRNSCRACRLKRCLQAGMRADLARKMRSSDSHEMEEGGRLDDNSPGQQPFVTSSSPTTSSSTAQFAPPLLGLIPQQNAQIVTLHFPLATPLSNQFHRAWRDLEAGHGAVVSQQFGLSVAIGKTLRTVTHAETMQLQRSSAPLLVALVHGQFPEFESFDNNLKLDFMKKFAMQFCLLYGAEITIRTFPNEDNLNKCCFYPGCVSDLGDKCEAYFKTITGIGKKEHMEICLSLVERYLKYIADVYKSLAVTQLEVAALSGIILLNSAQEFLGNKVDTRRNALYGELHSLAIQHHHQQLIASNQQNGSSNNWADSNAPIPIRFGQLLNLLNGFTGLSKDFVEVMSLSNVFLDLNSTMDFTTIWEEFFVEKTTPNK